MMLPPPCFPMRMVKESVLVTSNRSTRVPCLMSTSFNIHNLLLAMLPLGSDWFSGLIVVLSTDSPTCVLFIFCFCSSSKVILTAFLVNALLEFHYGAPCHKEKVIMKCLKHQSIDILDS
ncbi:hypothetical protein XENORESO_021596 [Xenotaenia resolanae]|uniref:Uncharacterized protein n=1 Tax=Xenotaenia resolanae TaxID=208358 RepID=A0ABV0W1N7_9TELE